MAALLRLFPNPLRVFSAPPASFSRPRQLPALPRQGPGWRGLWRADSGGHRHHDHWRHLPLAALILPLT
eukprot:7003122-Pyramimonas_sp.AAC.1